MGGWMWPFKKGHILGGRGGTLCIPVFDPPFLGLKARTIGGGWKIHSSPPRFESQSMTFRLQSGGLVQGWGGAVMCEQRRSAWTDTLGCVRCYIKTPECMRATHTHPPPASTRIWKDSKSNRAGVQELASTLFRVVPSRHLIPEWPGVTLSESSSKYGPTAIAHFLMAALFKVLLRQFRRSIMFQTVKRSL